MSNLPKPRATLDLCKLVAEKQLKEVESFVGSAQALLDGDPPDGSYAARVMEYARSIPTASERDAALFVVLHLSTAATKTLWNVRDHAVAFHAAINDARRPTTSLMTLARAMLEGTLALAHLLEPVGPELTLARGMAHCIDTMEGTLRMLRHAPDGVGPDTGEIQDVVREAYERFGSQGFSIQQTPKKPFTSTRVRFRDAEAIVDLKVTDLAARFLHHQPELYPVLSGTVHSKSWFLGAAFQIGDEPGDFATYEQSWGAALTAALDVSDILISTIRGALGLDAEPLMKRTHLRRRALVASMSDGTFSPMGHDDFRASPPGRAQTGGEAFGLRRDGA